MVKTAQNIYKICTAQISKTFLRQFGNADLDLADLDIIFNPTCLLQHGMSTMSFLSENFYFLCHPFSFHFWC